MRIADRIRQHFDELAGFGINHGDTTLRGVFVELRNVDVEEAVGRIGCDPFSAVRCIGEEELGEQLMAGLRREERRKWRILRTVDGDQDIILRIEPYVVDARGGAGRRKNAIAIEFIIANSYRSIVNISMPRESAPSAIGLRIAKCPLSQAEQWLAKP